MDNDINSDYFFHGSADTSPDPYDDSLVQYGLYEPVTDRFVLVSKFREPLATVSLLFSSRYQLHLCELHTAHNFAPNLIDNLCCYNWTIGNKNGLVLNESVREYTERDMFRVKQFLEAKPIADDDLIVKDREYFLAAFKWVCEYEQSFQLRAKEPFFKSEFKMQSLITLPCESTRTTLILQEIYDTIFTEYEFEAAKVVISKLIEEMR